MLTICRILLIFAVFQIPTWCFPLPEKGDIDIPVLIVQEKTSVTSSSPDELPVIVSNAESEKPGAPFVDDVFSNAALASIVQLIQKTLLSLPPPQEFSSGMVRMGALPDSGEVRETIIGPGTKLRVVTRNYKPPAFTSMLSGNVDGQNVNKVTQNQMYATQNLSVLQSGSNARKEEEASVRVPDSIGTPKNNDEAIVSKMIEDSMMKFKDEIEKLNSVLE